MKIFHAWTGFHANKINDFEINAEMIYLYFKRHSYKFLFPIPNHRILKCHKIGHVDCKDPETILFHVCFPKFNCNT